jgi:hypothetical protein
MSFRQRKKCMVLATMAEEENTPLGAPRGKGLGSN